jgi:small-conductance mechanosensitive channel
VFPSFTPASLVQLLGISSVAIGFAFRDIFQNFLAGILLLITRPFRIGDQIAWANEQGTVEDIQTRATLVKTYDGRRLVIPNANLFTNAVTVNTAFPQRRMEYDLEVPRNPDLDALRARMRAVVEGVPGVLASPAVEILVVELKPAALMLRVRWWIAPPRNEDVIASKDQVLRGLLPLVHTAPT